MAIHGRLTPAMTGDKPGIVKWHLKILIGVTVGLLGASSAPAAFAADTAEPSSLGTRGRVTAAKPRRAPLGTEALDKLRGLLADADQAIILTATQALADSGASNAAQPLIEMLAVGVRPPATIAAIDALKKLRDPTSVEVLALYAGNRGIEIRRHAVEAIGVFADARVVPILMDRLGDAAPEVRAAAADALATRDEKAAVPRLLALFKKNDAAAAAPLGALAPISALGELQQLQGGVSDDNLATALGEMLKRRDVPEPTRVEIVKALAGVLGASSTTALIEYVGSLPASDRRASKVQAQKVVDERGKQK